MGPYGDACVMVFNPGSAANVTIDLSSLPKSLLNASVVLYDLLTLNQTGQSDAPPVPPLTESWTVEMGAAEMKFYGGFSLGVFAPRQGKKTGCRSSYSRRPSSTTLQGCFLECLGDSNCENVFVDFVDVPWVDRPPSLNCTLIGAVGDPSTACDAGNGTLIKKLVDGRPGGQMGRGARD